MTEAFLKILNMSISASWLVLAVLLLRRFLKKMPKWVHVLLWGIVAVRLLCPFSIESALSLIPSAEVISPEILMEQNPQITTGIPVINSVVNPVLSDSLAPAPGDSANPLQIWIPIVSAIWLLGMAAMVGYTAVSYFRLRRKVRDAVPLGENIYRSASIPSPFVLGIVKSRIYLPDGMAEGDMAHVIAHEQAHIRRRDHWWKPLGFGLLTVHWFNPLMWAAYLLLCRDIELACDEKVIRELGRDQRADYSQTLLTCSVDRRMIAACPLAFGEVGVKERVRNVLSYKKPAFWVIVIAVILCIVVAICFLTNPAPSREFAMEGDNVADLDTEWITEHLQQITKSKTGLFAISGYPLTLTADFDWAEAGAVPFWYHANSLGWKYSSQLRLFYEEDQFYVTAPKSWEYAGMICFLEHYLDALKYMPQAQIRALSPDADRYIVNLVDAAADSRGPDSFERVITYTPHGVGGMYGWYVHLELLPLHEANGAYAESGGNAIHLFYGDTEWEDFVDAAQWIDNFSDPATAESEIQVEAFLGVTFRYTYGEITAEDKDGTVVLITGMPIWNAYLADLNGDGSPEICATVSYGSGIVDTHVVVYDYVNRREYTLWDRGNYDYYLRLENGKLMCDKKFCMSTEVFTSGGLFLADGERLVLHEVALEETAMVPTDADIHGLFGEYLYRTIDGQNYRYERQSSIPEGVTAGEYLETLTEADALGASYRWEVYAVEGCTDNTMVIAKSPGLGGAWLYQYSPSKRSEEGALQAARDAGYVIMEDGDLTGGGKAWDDFYEAARNGNAASVKVVHSYTLDPETTGDITYEAYREDYPCLYTFDLSYDGEVYTLSWEENGLPHVRTYEYLMKYTGQTLAASYTSYTRYVLTHDNTVTWEQLFSSAVSSVAGAYIDHYSICTDLK